MNLQFWDLNLANFQAQLVHLAVSQPPRRSSDEGLPLLSASVETSNQNKGVIWVPMVRVYLSTIQYIGRCLIISFYKTRGHLSSRCIYS